MTLARKNRKEILFIIIRQDAGKLCFYPLFLGNVPTSFVYLPDNTSGVKVSVELHMIFIKSSAPAGVIEHVAADVTTQAMPLFWTK